MADRKYITMSEFQGEGFLLEANRQFFHPHGLALEINRVSTEPGATPVHALALRDDTYNELCALLTTAGASDALIEAVHGARRYEVGEGYITGVWDCRDDPEGVIMAGLSAHERDKVTRVAAERARHRDARAELFGADTDIEPVDWAPKENAGA
jgi:hypothetical protein